MSLILAGDVGGTRARFAILDESGRKVLHQEVLESRTFPTFEGALAASSRARAPRLKAKGAIRAASFGIAGPVVDQRVKTTNLPWVIDARDRRRRVRHRARHAAERSRRRRPRRARRAARARSAASTAASRAARAATSPSSPPAPGSARRRSSGTAPPTSHAPPRARTSTSRRARRSRSSSWKVLAREYGHVSYERVASGSTISVLYTFFVRDQRVPESKASAALVARAPDQNVAVVDLAETGKSEAAMRAVELWSSVYGAEAGNLALKSLATSGVYVCGGASARLADVLAHGLPARKKSGRSPSGPSSGARSSTRSSTRAGCARSSRRSRSPSAPSPSRGSSALPPMRRSRPRRRPARKGAHGPEEPAKTGPSDPVAAAKFVIASPSA